MPIDTPEKLVAWIKSSQLVDAVLDSMEAKRGNTGPRRQLLDMGRDYALSIKANTPGLPPLPDLSGIIGEDCRRLAQWAVNASEPAVAVADEQTPTEASKVIEKFKPRFAPFHPGWPAPGIGLELTDPKDRAEFHKTSTEYTAAMDAAQRFDLRRQMEESRRAKEEIERAGMGPQLQALGEAVEKAMKAVRSDAPNMQAVNPEPVDAITKGIAAYNHWQELQRTEGQAAGELAMQEFVRCWVNHPDAKIALFFEVFFDISIRPVRKASGLDDGDGPSYRTAHFTDCLHKATVLGVTGLPVCDKPLGDELEADAMYHKLLSAVRASIAVELPAKQAVSPDVQALKPDPLLAATHSTDFTTVNWFGAEYSFALGVQSAVVARLWKEWEASGLGLHQRTIAQAVDSERDNFRLDKAFRGNSALGTMIQSMGDGKYKLVEPNAQTPKPTMKKKKSPRIPAKSLRTPR